MQSFQYSQPAQQISLGPIVREQFRTSVRDDSQMTAKLPKLFLFGNRCTPNEHSFSDIDFEHARGGLNSGVLNESRDDQ